MEYSVVVNNVEVVRVSGDEAAWTKFEQSCDLVRLLMADGSHEDAWAELRLPNGEAVARFDENGLNT